MTEWLGQGLAGSYWRLAMASPWPHHGTGGKAMVWAFINHDGGVGPWVCHGSDGEVWTSIGHLDLPSWALTQWGFMRQNVKSTAKQRLEAVLVKNLGVRARIEVRVQVQMRVRVGVRVGVKSEDGGGHEGEGTGEK